jgi:hypothetical protein
LRQNGSSDQSSREGRRKASCLWARLEALTLLERSGILLIIPLFGGVREARPDMEGFPVETLALAFLTALITPAIVLLACANLIAGCHMRLSQVVDRVRALAQMAEDIRLGRCTDHPKERRREIGAEFLYHERRGKMILIALSLLYGTVGFFVATSIAVGVDLLLDNSLALLPVVLAILGISLFFVKPGHR